VVFPHKRVAYSGLVNIMMPCSYCNTARFTKGTEWSNFNKEPDRDMHIDSVRNGMRGTKV
jgi:hypothetical protein